MSLRIVTINRDYMSRHINQFLQLEHNWKQIGDEPWKQENFLAELEGKWSLSNSAELDQRVIGYQIGSIRSEGKSERILYLNKLVVDAEARGSGIGRKLLKVFLEESLAHGMQRVDFKVRIDNENAVGFYDRLGFRRNRQEDQSRGDGVLSYYYSTGIREVMKNLREVT